MMTVTDPQSGSMLCFSHDAASRTITGPSAAMLLATVERWSGLGVIYGTQPVEAPDPLGSDRDMAVMLATFGYVLPESLWRLLPKPQPNPDQAGAIAGANEVAQTGLVTESSFTPRHPASDRARRHGRWREDNAPRD